MLPLLNWTLTYDVRNFTPPCLMRPPLINVITASSVQAGDNCSCHMWLLPYGKPRVVHERVQATTYHGNAEQSSQSCLTYQVYNDQLKPEEWSGMKSHAISSKFLPNVLSNWIFSIHTIHTCYGHSNGPKKIINAPVPHETWIFRIMLFLNAHFALREWRYQ